MRVNLFFIMLVCLVAAACRSGQKSASGHVSSATALKSATITFYNVENLFDTIDDPKIIDEDFLPKGKLNWNNERYQQKLQRLAEVIDTIPGSLPVFVGMCEIENRAVLNDLVKQPRIAGAHYEIIHQDSPDERGIDVVALYDPSRLKVLSFEYFQVHLPDTADPFTRDILYVKAKIQDDVVHFFVNHWPSRSGGQEVSEQNRLFAASVLKEHTAQILSVDPQAKILIMGDFNDYPINKSISDVLNAGSKPENTFYNYMLDDHLAKGGSYFYKGEWGALDQFMASKGLMYANKSWMAPDNSAHIFKNDLILFKDNEGISRPSRTYAGDSFKGGYSDHLPIYMDLIWK